MSEPKSRAERLREIAQSTDEDASLIEDSPLRDRLSKERDELRAIADEVERLEKVIKYCIPLLRELSDKAELRLDNEDSYDSYIAARSIEHIFNAALNALNTKTDD